MPTKGPPQVGEVRTVVAEDATALQNEWRIAEFCRYIIIFVEFEIKCSGMTRKRTVFALFVAVAAIALLAVTFVPHHHHNGFMCMEEEHFECHGTGESADSPDECHAEGDGHSEDRSNCIEDEAFLTSRSENNQMHLLPQPVQFFIAVVIAYLADDAAVNDSEKDFGDLPPCLYKSAELSGTRPLRAPPYLRA